MKVPVLIKMNIIFFFSDWSANNSFFVEGKKPHCFSHKPHPDHFFTDDHYGQIGFVRDCAVELARILYQLLNLTEANSLCVELEQMCTSTRAFFCWWTRIDRSDPKHTTLNDNVMKKAVAMIQDFNNRVVNDHKIEDFTQQKNFSGEIDKAIDRLKKANAANDQSPIVVEMNNMRKKFCEKYLSRIMPQPNNERTAETEAPGANAENPNQQPGVSQNDGHSIPVDDGTENIAPENGSGQILRTNTGLKRDASFARQVETEEVAAGLLDKDEIEIIDSRVAGELKAQLDNEAARESEARRRAIDERTKDDERLALELTAQMHDDAATQSATRRRVDDERSANDARIASEMAAQSRNEGAPNVANPRAAGTTPAATAARHDAPAATSGRDAIPARAGRDDTPAARAAAAALLRQAGQNQAPPSTGPTGSQAAGATSQAQPVDVSRWTVANPEDGDPFDDELNKTYPVIAFIYEHTPNDPANNEACKKMKSNVEQVILEKEGKVRLVTAAMRNIPLTCSYNSIYGVPHTTIYLKGQSKHQFEGVESVEKIREELDKVMREAGQTP